MPPGTIVYREPRGAVRVDSSGSDKCSFWTGVGSLVSMFGHSSNSYSPDNIDAYSSPSPLLETFSRPIRPRARPNDINPVDFDDVGDERNRFDPLTIHEQIDLTNSFEERMKHLAEQLLSREQEEEFTNSKEEVDKKMLRLAKIIEGSPVISEKAQSAIKTFCEAAVALYELNKRVEPDRVSTDERRETFSILRKLAMSRNEDYEPVLDLMKLSRVERASIETLIERMESTPLKGILPGQKDVATKQFVKTCHHLRQGLKVDQKEFKKRIDYLNSFLSTYSQKLKLAYGRKTISFEPWVKITLLHSRISKFIREVKTIMDVDTEESERALALLERLTFSEEAAPVLDQLADPYSSCSIS